MKVDRKPTFIKKAKEIHGSKYDYSKVEYVNAHTKVCIICPIHGEFWISPNSHLNGCGCSKCSFNKKITTEEFIEKAKEMHGSKYDYSKVDYVNNKTKVCIICPIHGEFWISPCNHLRCRGCPKCRTRKNVKPHNTVRCQNGKHTTEEFIKKAKEIHGSKYDYSKVDYVNNKTKVCIICPIHGEFWIRPDNFLNGRGCKKCGDAMRSKSKKTDIAEWIKMANKMHNNKYDYTKMNFVDTHTKICIVCPEHGEFWQKPLAHTSGQGCPFCYRSILEEEVISLLNEEKIKYVYRYHSEWLGKLELDFFLSDYNIGIECQGQQHYRPIEYFGGVESFIKQIKRDEAKKNICKEHNVELLYFSKQKQEGSITDINILKKKIYETNHHTLYGQ